MNETDVAVGRRRFAGRLAVSFQILLNEPLPFRQRATGGGEKRDVSSTALLSPVANVTKLFKVVSDKFS